MTSKDSKTLSQERFSRFAGGYVTSEVHAKGEELDRLVAIAAPRPDCIALDVATGGGHTALKFAPLVDHMIAVDISFNMLVAARDHIHGQAAKNIHFGQADAEDLPFDDESFDLVTCRIAPHHFPSCARFVKECSRVLKPRGLLLVQDHVLPDDASTGRYVDGFEKLRDPSHNHAFSDSQWVGMFEDAGLAVEHKEHIIKRHQFLRWAELQGCSTETIESLIRMVQEAPDRAVQWMQPRDFPNPQASFINHHIILSGRKKSPSQGSNP
ncbi:MAG: class I SAM-dependent methyltransferase [Proteobacteria bacterium]|nr:class I SAM-dependent methyltransferase [Pseudomonadota bacterium]